MADIKNQDSVYQESPTLYGKEAKPAPKPETEIGIDTKKTLFHNIVNAGVSYQVDLNSLNSFTSVSQSRDQTLSLIDTMCEDSKISAVLETYAEDTTDYNDEGRIVWCEASNPGIQHYISFLLDSINVDKHIFKWAYSLCKYGDVYLRLYRQSDIQNTLVDNNQINSKTKQSKKNKLNEDVKLKVHKESDPYVNYVEMVHNPATCFELTHFGKTAAYIKTSLESIKNNASNSYSSNTIQQMFQYKFSRNAVEVYAATDFVHGSLEDNSHRTPETVSIFSGEGDKEGALSYTVRRGQSLLYNTFKTWRELSLLENSLLLNRVTKSSIVRIISVEVGDMPKEMVGPHLQGIKSLIEQKSAITAGGSLQEYTNPGPVENNIYIPTHDQVGTITTSEIGGNPDVKNIVDIEYYLNQLYGGLRVPKQYFGQTDDAAGFSGGQSLSIISSRYAKMIKRIQNTLIQMLYDLVNLFLVDRNLTSYINKFTLKMQAPTTQEELDRRANLSSKVQLVRDVTDMLTDVEDPINKLKITKALLSNVITNTEVIQILEDEISRREKLARGENEESTSDETDDVGINTDSDSGIDFDMPSVDTSVDSIIPSEDASVELDTGIESTEDSTSGEQILPTPADLGVDLT